jgi:tetratricopeptide (TPR) repeat protein
MVYELATGANPFARESLAQAMAAHRETVPPPACEVNREISRFLSEIAARLLAKDPSLRLSPAAALADVLASGERSPWWIARESELAEREVRRPRIPVSRETAFRGRRDELAALADAWRLAAGGRGGVVLLEGEPGLGKTRLADAFVQEIAEPRTRVLYGAFGADGGISALTGAVRETLRPSLDASLASFLVETPGLRPGFAALLRGEAPPPGVTLPEGDGLALCFASVLRGLAQRGPVVWIIDDLDAAGADARALVLSIARAVEGRPALVVLAGDAGSFEREAAALTPRPGFRPVVLPRLSPREILDLVRDGLGSEPLAERLGARIAWTSDGVPLFALEIVRTLRESGAIVPGGDGGLVTTREIRELEIPSTMKDLVRSRFRDLEEEERAILDVAACCGVEFDADAVAGTLGLKVVLVLRKLAHLERLRRLVRSEGDRFRFDHHQVRETLYGEVPPRLRREYHSGLADHLASRVGPDADGAARAALARHLLLADRLPEALPLLDRALDHLEAVYANEAALELTDLALSRGEAVPIDSRTDLLLRRAGRLHLLGRRDEQRAALEEAVSLADRAGDPLRRCRAHRQLGAMCLSTARYAEAEVSLQAARPLAAELGQASEEVMILANLAVLSTCRGRYSEARDLFRDALLRARAGKDRKLVSVTLRNLGVAQQTLGEYEPAEVSFTEAVAVARTLGDPRLLAAGLGALGGLRYLKGRKEEALALLAEQQALARKSGDRNLELDAATGLSAVAYALGHLEEALRSGQRTLELARDIGQREAEGRALVNLGLCRLALGDMPSARAAFEDAYTRAGEIGSRWLLAYARQWRGTAMDLAGEPAEEELSAALALQRELRHQAGVADTLLALGRHLVHAGRAPAAAPHLAEALALATEADLPDAKILAAAWRARGAGGSVTEAAELLEANRELADGLTILEASYCIHRAGGGARYLAEARKILAGLLDRSPPECRRRMLEQVALYRDTLE